MSEGSLDTVQNGQRRPSVNTDVENLPGVVVAVMAVLSDYLPLSEPKAKAWAITLVDELAKPVPDRVDTRHFLPAEIESAARWYMRELRPEDFANYRRLLEACRHVRETWIKRVHDEHQDLSRTAIPALTGDDPEMRDHVSTDPEATRARFAKILGDLSKSKAVRGRPIDRRARGRRQSTVHEEKAADERREFLRRQAETIAKKEAS